jgi:hypothetical protein
MKLKNKRIIELTNQRFGSLTAIEIDDNKHNRIFWVCKCDCGNIKSVAARHLRSESITSCGCAKFLIGNTSRTWKGYGEISKKYFTNTKRGAISRSLEFSITIEDMWDIFLKQKRKCALTGENIYFRNRVSGEQTASIDRINSNEGYSIENIQWVHKDVNLMKQNLSEDKLFEICKQIVEYKKLK